VSPKGAATRARVIIAAQDAIYDLGFSKASSREIMRRSGLTFGVIQHHFGTYEALLVATIEHAVESQRALLATLEVEGTTTEEKLTWIADAIWEYYKRPAYVTYLEIYTNLVRDPSTSEEAIEGIKKINAEVERLWGDLMRRTFGRTPEQFVLQRLLFGTMRGLAISRWLNQGKRAYSAERQMLVAGLAAYLDGVPTSESAQG
jgi:AcrR family transcriptional regulator